MKSGETVYRCRARGVFKERGIKPAVGDRVEIAIGEEEDNSTVTEILPRKNVFVRPFVANVDCFVVVTSIAGPAPAFQTIDRFLVMAEKADTDIVICLSKCDLADPEGRGGARKAAKSLETLKEIYSPVYPVVCVGSDSDDGIEELLQHIKGKRAALAGASGVGKSTLLNRIMPDAGMETGAIHEKSQRGKHTTRHSQLFTVPVKGCGDAGDTMIFDTPGFTSFDIMEADEEELQHLYPEIGKHAGKCRYDNCRHIAEPGCAVKEALSRGEISESRYESYKLQMEEIKR